MDFIRQLNDFQIYRTQNETYHSGYRYKHSLPFEKIGYPVELTLWFQDHWHHSVTIAVLYFVAIKILQKWMTNRPAFRLETPLFYWNTAHAIYSIVAFTRLSEDYFHSLFNQSFYDTVCRTCHPNDVAAFWCVSFAFSKIAELGDTAFIVLRKRPLIFLHYYHHAAVLVYTIHSGSEHNSAGRTFILMNLFAHSCMYTYYAVKALNIYVPKSIAMAVTTIQTIQMVAGVFLSIFVYIVKTKYGWRCQQSIANVYLAFLIYATFGFLFVRFFHKTYMSSSGQKSRKMEKKNE